MKLLTRKEIIEIWSKQSDTHLNTYTCPNCRDLLVQKGDSYVCINGDCGLHGVVYKGRDIINEK